MAQIVKSPLPKRAIGLQEVIISEFGNARQINKILSGKDNSVFG